MRKNSVWPYLLGFFLGSAGAGLVLTLGVVFGSKGILGFIAVFLWCAGVIKLVYSPIE